MDNGPLRKVGLLRRLLFFGLAIPGSVLVCGALCLTFHAATWRGGALGVSVTVLVLAVLLILRFTPPGRHRARFHAWAGLGGIVAPIALGAVLIALAPKGQGGDEQIHVEHVFPGPGVEFPRFSLANVLPEQDQVAMGVALAHWIDPLIDNAQAERLRRLTFPLYEGIARDPAFANIGSVMTWAYGDLRGETFDPGHYVAIGRRPPERDKATIVFLHGSAGNFSCYWHALSPLVRQHGHTVIFPSFGFGNWHRSTAIDVVRRSTIDARSRFERTRSPSYLVALSSAGGAALRTVAAYPELFRGVVLLSAIVENDSIEKAAGHDGWASVRILLIHGTDDRRAPLSETRQRMSGWLDRGADLSERTYQGEDHFLLFSSRQRVLGNIAAWIEADA